MLDHGMLHRIRPRIIIFAAVVLALAAALGLASHLAVRDGGGVATSGLGGPFSLVDPDGKVVTEKSFPGRLKLVLFGFTHCPDVCPTGLAAMSEALEQLGPQAAGVQARFISVDPERDTPAVLRDYVSVFPGVLALSGTAEAVAAAAQAYRVYVARVSPTGGPVAPGSTDYVVDHTALIYLMAGDGSYLGFFKTGTGPDEMAAALKSHLD